MVVYPRSLYRVTDACKKWTDMLSGDPHRPAPIVGPSGCKSAAEMQNLQFVDSKLAM